MSSIFERAMGSDWQQLHPRMQHRLGVGVESGRACVGRGVMDEIWHGHRIVAPFLRLGAHRHLLFPETGRDVPFTIENYPYVDSFGRETVTFVRTFEVAPGRRRRFDATMVLDPQRGTVIDYLGTHQHVAADLELSVDAEGGLRIDCDVMRLHEGPLSVPLPTWVSGRATVRERWDERADCYRIRVEVQHGVVGPVFGYHGWFRTRDVDAHDAPAAVRPHREEIRA